MSLFKNNYFERGFAGNGLQSIVHYLRKLVNGFDSNTQTSNGGGIEGVNSKLDVVANKLDTLDISVKVDDPNIAGTKTNTDTIKSDLATIKTNTNSSKSDLGTVKTNTNTIKDDLASIKNTLNNIYTLLQSHYQTN